MMKQERNKKLVKDVLIYGIGNTGSRFMAFLIIPFLSFYIQSEEIGFYDVSLTTIMFLLPVTTLQMRESIFRLLIDNENAEYRKSILSTTFFIEGLVFGIMLIAAFVTPVFVEIRAYILIVLSMYVYSFYELYQYAVRVLYSPLQFAIMGIITSVLTVVFTLLLLFAFNMGIEALFIGNIVSRLLSVIINEIPRRRFLHSLSFGYIRRERVKEIFKYSIPMLVSAVAFGVIILVGKYMTKHLCGYDCNGVVAVAEKYVSIISIIGLTFYMAWQETAVRNFDQQNSQAYFSSIFNRYALLLSLLVICVAFGVRIFAFMLLGKGYEAALNIMFIYGTGLLFYGLSTFFDVIIQCTKQTLKLMYPILISAGISPFLFFILIKQYGLTGYAVALCILYTYLFVHRYFQTKKNFPIMFSRDFYLSILLIMASGTAYFVNNRYVDYSIMFLAVVSLPFAARIMSKTKKHGQQI